MPESLSTYCPNCERETQHEHEHGPQDGLNYCRTKCRRCGAEMEVESDPEAPPAHMASEATRQALS